MTPPIQLTTLGALALTLEGRPVLLGRRKPLTLLAYLARAGGADVRRAELAQLFWATSDEPRARQSLRQTLTELREILGDALRVTDQQVALGAARVQVDANAFQAAVSEGRYGEALELWGGDFLPDAELSADEDLRAWLEAEREGLRRSLAVASEAEVQRLASQGAWTEAGSVARRWTARAPNDERAARRLIEVLLLAGQKGEAAGEYRAVRQRLDAIGLEPSAELTSLAQAAEKPAADSSLGVFALLSPDLVGRADALSVLQRSWQGASRGESGSLVLTGDPGSGKSRLLEEFVRGLRRDSPRAIALYTRAFEAEHEAPYALVRHLFAGLARAPGLAGAPPAVLRSLAERIPEIAEAFPNLPHTESAPPSEAIARAIADVAAENPVLIAVDDAHLADSQSRSVLDALARRPPRNCLLIVAIPAESAGDFSGTRLGLPRLDASQVDQLLASMAEFRPEDRSRLARRLFEETRGNPLAVVEIVRALAEQGAIGPGPDGAWRTGELRPDVPLPVPVTLSEAALSRIEGLSPDARAVLEASVVIGRELDPAMLLELTGFENERLERALEDLVGRRLLKASLEGSSRLEFAHEHLRRAVYETLPPLRRAEWHHRSYRLLKRRPSRDSTRTAMLAHHQARGVSARRRWYRSPIGIGAAAIMVLLLGAGAWYWSRPATSSGATLVRVEPFAVVGDSALGFLGGAASQVISQGLNGAAGLRTVDSGAADLVVRGRVVVTGSRINITAALADPRRPDEVLAQASALGEAHDAITVSRDAARQLLQSRAGADPGAAGVLDWVNTRSIDALREYLEGERLFHALEIPEAIQAYRRATRYDTAFAVAWYRIGESGLWLLRTDVARVGADSAVHYLSGLDPYEIIHYQALQDFANGRIGEAEAKLRGTTAVFRHRTESRYLLADLLYHFYWLKGVGTRESRALFESLRRDQPGDWRPLFHLWDMAVADGRMAEAAALRDTIHALAPAADLFTSFDAITRFAAADSTGRRQVLDSLATTDQWTLANLVRRYANFTKDPAGTLALSALLTASERPPEVRATGHLFRAIAFLSMGRFARARDAARQAEAGSPITSYQWASLLLAPGLEGGAELASERARLSATLAGSGGIPLVPLAAPYYPWTDFDRRDAEDIFPYLRGRLALAAGDTAAAVRWLETLSQTSRATGELRPTLTSALGAMLAAHRGQRDAAIRMLDSAFARRPVDHSIMSVFVALPEERLALADWLAAAGRTADAIGWLDGIGEGTIYDLALVAPASLEQGQLLEQQGDRSGARVAYQRVVNLYREADPEFRSLATRATERLRALTAR